MKKHKLLREDILPAMASNRKVQRLLNEFMDLLSEYENTDTSLEQKHLTPSTSLPTADQSSLRTTDQMDSDLLVIDQPESAKGQTDSTLPTKDCSGPPVEDQMDVSSEKTNQALSFVPVTDQSKLDLPATDTVNLVPPTKESSS